ncbi:MAG: hypothetical protein VB061_08220 [Christensenella sp.]|nr:hypothetical protein [Christensenella sp.]
MNKFILVGQICGVGGWQTYNKNKAALMSGLGWDVAFVCPGKDCNGENIKLLDLNKYPYMFLEELSFYPSYFSVKRRREVVERIRSLISGATEKDEIIIETNAICPALWGEYISKELGAKHLPLLVYSVFPKITTEVKKYLDFKYSRRELVTMYNNGLHELLADVREVPVSGAYVVDPLTYNEYADDGKDYEALLKTHDYDWVVGSIGWLDKKYISEFINQLYSFAAEHSNKKILFIVVGNSTTGDKEQMITEKLGDLQSVRCELMGSIAPLPSNLITLFDVCVASHGCAVISDTLGVTTVQMLDDRDIPTGVMGYTLTEWPYDLCTANKEPVGWFLEATLVRGEYRKCDHVPLPLNTIYKAANQGHISFLAGADKDNEYYDITGIREPGMKNAVKRILVRTLGAGSVIRLKDSCKWTRG